MGELVITTFVTLDGVMQAPGGPDEDHDAGFQHGGWQAPFFDDTSSARVFETYTKADALLLGRRTYEIFASYWPTARADNPFTQRINALPRYVASRTLDEAGWPGTTILDGDLAGEVRALKERHATIIVPGSSDLIQSLLREELADRIEVFLHPIALGEGKRLFGDGTVPAAFRLTESATFDQGVALLSYERAGRPAYGDATELD